MMAYLAMMAPRLIELHRVLKVTGSIYLHCDPTASHYLKMLMDGVFGPQNFRSEVIWKRTSAHSSSKRYGPVHDVILYYTKSGIATWNKQYQPYDDVYMNKKFSKVDDKTGQPFQDHDLTGPGIRTGPSGRPWRGCNPTAAGRHWQPASYLYTKYRQLTGNELNAYPLLERLDKLDEIGLIYWTGKKDGFPRYKQFLADAAGLPLQDVWTDIDVINSQADERLGYQTQKPEAILGRIIKASSNEGDVVLDPFCGCGTAIAAAQKLNRRWIGIDITHLAIGLIKNRLYTAFGPEIVKRYDVVGEPTDLESAKVLAQENRFQFQAWALGLVGARTAHSSKMGSDRGIDGKLFFRDEKEGELKQIILSVKSGGVQVKDVRDLVGVINREKAELGVLITLEPPSKPMLREAVDAGFYKSPHFSDEVPRVQVRTIEELLAGRGIQYPRLVDVTFKPAPKAKSAAAKNLNLNLE